MVLCIWQGRSLLFLVRNGPEFDFPDFQETGSIDYAHTYALDLTAKAKAAIENVELDPHARELFLSMADFFVERLN